MGNYARLRCKPYAQHLYGCDRYRHFLCQKEEKAVLLRYAFTVDAGDYISFYL